MAENKFRYTYSAPTEEERREIDGIRRAYRPEEEKTGLDKLRALDKKVRRPAAWAAAVLGVVGVLIFGGGMALTLEGGADRGGDRPVPRRRCDGGACLSRPSGGAAAGKAEIRRGDRAPVRRAAFGRDSRRKRNGGKDAVRRLRFLEK